MHLFRLIKERHSQIEEKDNGVHVWSVDFHQWERVHCRLRGDDSVPRDVRCADQHAGGFAEGVGDLQLHVAEDLQGNHDNGVREFWHHHLSSEFQYIVRLYSKIM